MSQLRTNVRNLLVGANRAECLAELDNAMREGDKDRIDFITEFICDYWRDWADPAGR